MVDASAKPSRSHTPRALITGITGQDGSYLAEFLLEEGYEVHGTIRRTSLPNTDRLDGFRDQLHLHHADLTDATGLAGVIAEADPDEVYNLGALSDVRISFETPEFSGNVTGLGCARMLELLRTMKPETRFYQAGSSEMFGENPNTPTSETDAFHPVSPYAVAKVYAHGITKVYRESYGMFAANGVLFNHESERRGVDFVTRKITLGLADIVAGRADDLVLGNLDAKRDWGHARDYVRAMWLILHADEPSDYVIATGETHSVREFLQIAFDMVGLDWHRYVKTDPKFYRPVDPPVLLGDASKAQTLLGWEPHVRFEELVRLMVESDLK
jgi:GDPmannose 4,6-dehydratase